MTFSMQYIKMTAWHRENIYPTLSALAMGVQKHKENAYQKPGGKKECP
jgi:hypothetical protein